MNIQLVRKPAESRFLIVDDEENICLFLKEALADSYNHIDTAFNATKAISAIRQTDYDVIVTDLRLPDLSGIEVLRAAKAKDEHTEVIVITGYASIESASEAINLGVTSYLCKPLSLEEFLIQVERAVATRIFHLKSMALMDHSHQIAPEVKEHLHDITNLYYFSRKLMLALEVPEIMRTILEEANERLGAAFCAVGVKFLEFCEVFAMPRCGEMSAHAVRSALINAWNSSYDALDKARFENEEIPLVMFKGRQDSGSTTEWKDSINLPMSVLGQSIGFISVFGDASVTHSAEREQFLYVFTSMISSIVEHAYRDMQAKLQAKTDSLTGVANHRMFHETLDREIARADRSGRGFCLALLDIDDFKKVNDTYGHLVGDAVLIDCTRRIASQNRRGDVLARYGGEEFALILPDTSIDGGGILTRRICDAVAARPFIFAQTKVPYTLSIGLAQYDGGAPRGKDQLIKDADEALYESKKSGKNRVSVR